MDFARNNELIIDDNNYLEHCSDIIVDGEQKGFGLTPRNYGIYPAGSIESVPAWDPRLITLYTREEWSSRIKDKQQAQSQLSDIRLSGDAGASIPSLDQGQSNFCWVHSTTHGETINRAIANEPYIALSAYAVACLIKDFRNEGGWGGLSMEYIIKHGIPPQSMWPQGSFSRSYNNPATWKEAEKYKITGAWCDLSIRPYDRNFSFDQLISCLLQDIPVVMDLNWWGHSILGLDAIEYDTSLKLSDINRWGVRIWNSWGNSWSDRGMGLLRGNKAVPNGAVASRTSKAA